MRSSLASLNSSPAPAGKSYETGECSTVRGTESRDGLNGAWVDWCLLFSDSCRLGVGGVALDEPDEVEEDSEGEVRRGWGVASMACGPWAGRGRGGREKGGSGRVGAVRTTECALLR